MAGKIVAAEETGTASHRKRNNNTIAFFQFCDRAARFLDHAHEFMTEHEILNLRKESVVNVQVRSADRGRGDAQNNILRVFNYGIVDVIDRNFAGMMEDKSFHDYL